MWSGHLHNNLNLNGSFWGNDNFFFHGSDGQTDWRNNRQTQATQEVEELVTIAQHHDWSWAKNIKGHNAVSINAVKKEYYYNLGFFSLHLTWIVHVSISNWDVSGWGKPRGCREEGAMFSCCHLISGFGTIIRNLWELVGFLDIVGTRRRYLLKWQKDIFVLKNPVTALLALKQKTIYLNQVNREGGD